MKRTIYLMLLALILMFTTGFSQTVFPCFDLNSDGATDLNDLVYCSEIFVGHVALTTAPGDIDGRAGFNLGDFRYFTGWIFLGYSLGSCPPHPAYSILPDIDSVFLGSAVIPAGTGQIQLPIVIKSQHLIDDLLIPFHVSTTSGTATVTNVSSSGPETLVIFNANWTGDWGIFQSSAITSDHALAPGVHLVAFATVSYDGSTGGTVSLDTTSLSESYQFPHYLYGDPSSGYSATTIAIPAVAAAAPSEFPTMTVAPDSLYYETLVDYPNPDPQSFTVQSDAGPFSWSLTSDSWIQTSISSGVSSQSVDVTPDITGMAVGTHHGTIVITSTDAIGSPKIVDVYVKLKSQYPAFDANCDGQFSIADVVMQINYIFGSGEITCDPCTGQPNYKKK